MEKELDLEDENAVRKELLDLTAKSTTQTTFNNKGVYVLRPLSMPVPKQQSSYLKKRFLATGVHVGFEQKMDFDLDWFLIERNVYDSGMRSSIAALGPEPEDWVLYWFPSQKAAATFLGMSKGNMSKIRTSATRGPSYNGYRWTAKYMLATYGWIVL